MKEITGVFKALSDTTRLRIMSTLLRADTALCICEIVDTLGLPQYTVSKQMKELKHAGLVEERREGRFIFYSVTPSADDFRRKLMDVLRASLAGVFPDDNTKLLKRLSLRENDRCVVGLRKCGKKGKVYDKSVC